MSADGYGKIVTMVEDRPLVPPGAERPPGARFYRGGLEECAVCASHFPAGKYRLCPTCFTPLPGRAPALETPPEPDPEPIEPALSYTQLAGELDRRVRLAMARNPTLRYRDATWNELHLDKWLADKLAHMKTSE